MKKRNTKQKQIILETLRKDKTHPTITEIYEKVSKKQKNIGKATVYRNVNDLVDNDQVKKIVDEEGNFHYDGNEKEHIHLICKNCKKIIDIFDTNQAEFIETVAKENSILIESAIITFEGFCSECKKLLSK